MNPKKYHQLFALLLILLASCQEKIDRDHLTFKHNWKEVETKIIEMDNLLYLIPAITDTNSFSYQNYYLKNGHLYINNESVVDIEKPDVAKVEKKLSCNKEVAAQFVTIALFLNEEGIDGAVNECMGWSLFYKASNDRGQYRAIKLSDKGLEEKLKFCSMSIIDKKGRLRLIIPSEDLEPNQDLSSETKKRLVE